MNVIASFIKTCNIIRKQLGTLNKSIIFTCPQSKACKAKQNKEYGRKLLNKIKSQFYFNQTQSKIIDGSLLEKVDKYL